MSIPKKILVSSVDATNGELIPEWEFTLEGEKVTAKELRKNAFNPNPWDSEAEGEDGKGRYLTPKDGSRFMEKLKDAFSRASYINLKIDY